MSITPNDSCDRSSQAYTDYIPAQSIVEALTPLLNNINIVMVLGTWCSDSQQHVPPFYKILDEAGLSAEATSRVEVDQEKKAVNGQIDYLDIISIPTFIIFEQGKEIGRIVEQPVITLEQDLLQLLLNK